MIWSLQVSLYEKTNSASFLPPVQNMDTMPRGKAALLSALGQEANAENDNAERLKESLGHKLCEVASFLT